MKNSIRVLELARDLIMIREEEFVCIAISEAGDRLDLRDSAS